MNRPTADRPGSIRVEVLGAVVPFVRVARERGTRRVNRYHASRKLIAGQLAAALAGGKRPEGAVYESAPWAVEISFFRWNKNGDVDNLAKTVLDSAQGIVFADDVQVRRLSVWVFRAARGADRFELHAYPIEHGEV